MYLVSETIEVCVGRHHWELPKPQVGALDAHGRWLGVANTRHCQLQPHCPSTMDQALACRPLHPSDHPTNLYTGTNCMHCMRLGGLLGGSVVTPQVPRRGTCLHRCVQNHWTGPDWPPLLLFVGMTVTGGPNELNVQVPKKDSQGTQGTMPEIVRCAVQRAGKGRPPHGKAGGRAAPWTRGVAVDTSCFFYRSLRGPGHGNLGLDALLVLALHTHGDAISEASVKAAAQPLFKTVLAVRGSVCVCV